MEHCAAVNLVNYIQSQLNARSKTKKVSAVFLDLQKAFDSVYHENLLDVLSRMGVRGKCHDLISSYLSKRFQVVRIDGILSDPLPITRGVVQGSILGPLLFLFIINDVTMVNTRGHLILYADDAVLLQSHGRHESINDSIAEDMRKILSFFDQRKLTLNEKKTVFMVFHTPFKVPLIPDQIKINESFSLFKVESFKYLGLWLDSSVSFNNHIKHLEKKIGPAVGVLWKLKEILPLAARKKVFDSLIMSHLQYLVTCWGSATDKALQQLQVMQNRAIRTVFNENYKSHRKEIYEDHDILPIRGLCLSRTAIFTHSVIYGYKLTYISIDDPQLKRNGIFINPSRVDNNYGAKAITCIGPRIFNKLPSEAKNEENPHKFKSIVKKHILTSGLINEFFTKNFLEITKYYSQ